jgi:hypothetical protein
LLYSFFVFIFDPKTNNNTDMRRISEMSNRQIRQHYNARIKELSRYRHGFEIEKNIKNSLYAFVIGKGLYNDLVAYSRTHQMSDPGGHERSIKEIGMRFPENMN